MKIYKGFLAVLILAAAAVSTGCATIASGTTQKVSVSTQPMGADAQADGNVTIKTPGHLTLDRKSDHTIVVSKEGYKTATVFIRKTMNEMATGNVLIGGVIGIGIDAASGAGNKLIPERIDLVLEEGSGEGPAKFASEKDQKFYDERILTKKLEADQKAYEREAKKAEETEKKTASNNFAKTADPAAGADAAVPAAGSNFGPKAR